MLENDIKPLHPALATRLKNHKSAIALRERVHRTLLHDPRKRRITQKSDRQWQLQRISDNLNTKTQNSKTSIFLRSTEACPTQVSLVQLRLPWKSPFVPDILLGKAIVLPMSFIAFINL